jgi:molybdopterin converting factor small subunit
MDAATVTVRLPAGLYAELQTLAQEEQAEPVAILSQLVKAARQQRAWLNDLAALRKQIEQDGGLQVGATKEEVVERLRRTRHEIFEAEYAHLY